MTTPPPNEKHPLMVGKIVSNLSSLELMMRIVLAKIEASAAPPGTIVPKLDGYKVGDKVPADAITNYDYLRKTILKYNAHALPAELVDVDLVELRDALAHGRVSTADPSKPLELVKFDRPDANGMVEVTTVETMDDAWLEAQKARTVAALQRVQAAAKRLGVSP